MSCEGEVYAKNGVAPPLRVTQQFRFGHCGPANSTSPRGCLSVCMRARAPRQCPTCAGKVLTLATQRRVNECDEWLGGGGRRLYYLHSPDHNHICTWIEEFEDRKEVPVIANRGGYLKFTEREVNCAKGFGERSDVDHLASAMLSKFLPSCSFSLVCITWFRKIFDNLRKEERKKYLYPRSIILAQGPQPQHKSENSSHSAETICYK